jgi:pimeloyl-ACP methyl ester carboxylesterase
MTTYHSLAVDGVNIFYREAGPKDAPTLVLLHGFPSSSHMYRELIDRLSPHFHLIAPDYPGFGYSDAPDPDTFTYSFDHLADVIERFLQTLGITRFSLFLQDYGGPLGFRLATHHPERIEALIIQNANAYLEGVTPALAPIQAYWQDRNETTEAAVRALLRPETTKFQYTQGARSLEQVSPDAWTVDQHFLDRPGNDAIQLALLYDYRTNVELYPEWQAYLRKHLPPTLVVWGQNDPFFGPAGARAYQRDVPEAEIHLLDTGHFALEEDADEIAALIRQFLASRARVSSTA